MRYLRSSSAWLWRLLAQDAYLSWLLGIAALYFLFYYFTDPLRPADMFTGLLGFKDYAQYPEGWFGFTDQGSYLREAHTLASLHFSQLHTTFLYGLGYPLVAVPFIWLGFDKDPFVFFNFFAFLFAVFTTYKVANKLVSPLAGVLAGFGLVFATPLIHYTDQPWNTTVCLVAVCSIMLVAVANKIKPWHFALLGLMVGWSFSARYADALFLGVLALASLYRGSVKSMLKPILLMAVGVLVVVLPVFYAHDRIFGSPFKTPYVLHIMNGTDTSDQQLTSYSIGKVPRKSVAILAGPRLLGLPDPSRGLLVDMFWSLLAIPGAYILLRKTPNKLFVATLAGFMIVVSLFYLSFRGTDVDSVEFGLLHYFKMLWPGAVIFAAAFLDHQINKSNLLKSARTKK